MEFYTRKEMESTAKFIEEVVHKSSSFSRDGSNRKEFYLVRWRGDVQSSYFTWESVEKFPAKDKAAEYEKLVAANKSARKTFDETEIPELPMVYNLRCAAQLPETSKSSGMEDTPHEYKKKVALQVSNKAKLKEIGTCFPAAVQVIEENMAEVTVLAVLDTKKSQLVLASKNTAGHPKQLPVKLSDWIVPKICVFGTETETFKLWRNNYKAQEPGTERKELTADDLKWFRVFHSKGRILEFKAESFGSGQDTNFRKSYEEIWNRLSAIYLRDMEVPCEIGEFTKLLQRSQTVSTIRITKCALNEETMNSIVKLFLTSGSLKQIDVNKDQIVPFVFDRTLVEAAVNATQRLPVRSLQLCVSEQETSSFTILTPTNRILVDRQDLRAHVCITFTIT